MGKGASQAGMRGGAAGRDTGALLKNGMEGFGFKHEVPPNSAACLHFWPHSHLGPVCPWPPHLCLTPPGPSPRVSWAKASLPPKAASARAGASPLTPPSELQRAFPVQVPAAVTHEHPHRAQAVHVPVVWQGLQHEAVLRRAHEDAHRYGCPHLPASVRLVQRGPGWGGPGPSPAVVPRAQGGWPRGRGAAAPQ